jgi:hypothetical protein
MDATPSSLPCPDPLAAHRAALEREKDALRIQAAAVAAQQAALTEEEIRLEQRKVALERQESQLSIHLEERRRKLVELQEQVRESRTALRNERAEHDKHVHRTADELRRSRSDVEAGLEKLREERRHLSELHRRLKLRHAAHWKATEAGLRKREDQVADERRKLEADRAAQIEARLRFNGEAELGRRQLQDSWDTFYRAQKQWEERRAHEQAELRRRDRELTEAEYGLTEQWRQWEETRQAQQAEADGLESRIRNLRRKVHEHEQEAQQRGLIPSPAVAPVETAPAPLPATPSSAKGERERLAALEALSGQLADQRLHLMEQAARLARAREEWRAEQAAALAQLDEAARRLQEQETRGEPRRRELAEAEADLRRRAEESARRQAHLDGWQSRLTARAAAWEADREGLLATVRSREEMARRQTELLAELRGRWEKRRKKEATVLRGALRRCTAARDQYAALWEECRNRSAALEQQQRALAEQALALEQYRLEMVGRAPDAVAADRKIEGLRRRVAAATAAARRNLDRERQAVHVETRRLHEWGQRLDKQAESLAAREAELSRQLSKLEEGQAGDELLRARLQAEVQTLLARRAQHEREAQTLRDEVERMARLLMEDGLALASVGQAA